MQVLNIVTKLMKCTLTGMIKNRKAEVYNTDIRHKYSD